ncbi:MAG TPA: hypothetical protein ENJ60_00510 [Aeromonadales bacterium]|nr:hypothetical protein [Aeromonadales bacterium]
MVDTEEQRLDIIKNCNLLLDGYLSHFKQTDDSPQGRMSTQLKWLKERAENHDLPLPVQKKNWVPCFIFIPQEKSMRYMTMKSRYWNNIIKRQLKK